MITKKTIAKWALDGTLDRHLATKATKKNHKHLHNPSRKPSKSIPREMRKKRSKRKAG